MIRQGKGNELINPQKAARRAELSGELAEHECKDRLSGRNEVRAIYSSILECMCDTPSLDPNRGQLDDPDQKVDDAKLNPGDDDSDSVAEGYTEPTDGMDRTVPRSKCPMAYRARGTLIKKGMMCAIMPTETDESDPLYIVITSGYTLCSACS